MQRDVERRNAYACVWRKDVINVNKCEDRPDAPPNPWQGKMVVLNPD